MKIKCKYFLGKLNLKSWSFIFMHPLIFSFALSPPVAGCPHKDKYRKDFCISKKFAGRCNMTKTQNMCAATCFCSSQLSNATMGPDSSVSFNKYTQHCKSLCHLFLIPLDYMSCSVISTDHKANFLWYPSKRKKKNWQCGG